MSDNKGLDADPNQRWIYVLELVHGKYYIGKTRDVMERFERHKQGRAAVWTRIFPPVELIEAVEMQDKYEEDKYVLKYMELYGIENVRGGTWCNIKLMEDEMLMIRKQIASANDACFECGKKGHYASECYFFQDI